MGDTHYCKINVHILKIILYITPPSISYLAAYSPAPLSGPLYPHTCTYELAPAYRHFIRGKEPQSMTYSLDRFLGRNGYVDYERPPVAFMRGRDQATAEAEATAAMRARLDAFDQQFSLSTNDSRNYVNRRARI